MKPVSPVVPGRNLHEVVFGKNQPEYRPLPAIKAQDGSVLSRWKLNWGERLIALWRGDVYLKLLTFGSPVQPSLLSVIPPKLEE